MEGEETDQFKYKRTVLTQIYNRRGRSLIRGYQALVEKSAN